MKSGEKIILSILLVVNVGMGGCAGTNTVRDFFLESRAGLEVAMQDLLLESVQIISLLEDYRSSLEEEDLEGYMECFSERFSYYEKGLEWLRSRVRADYFRQFDEFSAALDEIEVTIVKKERALWLRQDAFDWLEGDGGGSTFSRSYLIRLRPEWGSADVLFEAIAPSPPAFSGTRPDFIREEQVARAASRSRCPSPPTPPTSARHPGEVLVRVRSDPLVDTPLGEVSFKLSIRARSESGIPGEKHEYALREKVIFLLEKEEEGWKIISRE